MEIFSPKKCCFCLPLRKGLLSIGYLRLIICLLTIAQLTLMCLSMFERMKDSYEDAIDFLQSVAAIVPQLLDLIFTLTLIVAAHKKNVKLLIAYYLYCITMLLVYSLVVVLIACDQERFMILYYMILQFSWFINGDYYEFIGLGVIVFLLQFYIILLVRSEVCHLKKKNEAELARQRSNTSLGLPQLNKII